MCIRGEHYQAGEILCRIQLFERRDIIKGNAPQAEKSGNVIVFSVTGKPIIPRSENQLKLVEAFAKNDMLFAIGPAGSGKTYTAIALAVRALKNKEIKKIIKMMTPQIQTNLSKSNILGLGIRLPQYNIVGTDGWPYNVSTGYISGVSYVFPSNLAENVKELHVKFFGQTDYVPSSKVNTISSTIAQKIEAERNAGNIENEENVTVDTSQQNQSKPPAENSGGGSSGGGGQGGSGSGTGGSEGEPGDSGSTGGDSGDSGGDSGDSGNTGGDSGGESGGDSGNTGGETAGENSSQASPKVAYGHKRAA